MSRTILFNGPASWKEKVVSADNIWSQVSNILSPYNIELPQTPRRPDVRLIVNNTSGLDQVFRNPANHANDRAERIPGAGDNTAAMIMVAGETLEEQHKNARTLFEKYDLGNKGLSPELVGAIVADRVGGLVKEAYGPAPFAGQSSKLAPLDWKKSDGGVLAIAPVFGQAASYGARPATSETAFNTLVHVFVQGTKTTPELIESSGMVIALSKDSGGNISTRPIVASVAREIYGEGFNKMPQVVVHPDGYVTKIDLRNGTVFELAQSQDSMDRKFGYPRP
jgi:hypothetical protein